MKGIKEEEKPIVNMPLLIPKSVKGEIWTEERCFIKEILNDDSFPDFSMAIARVEVGVTTQLHLLKGIVETYVIKKGFGVVEINGTRYNLKPMDSIIIPEGFEQRITNTGLADLEFYCICRPRFIIESYVNREK